MCVCVCVCVCVCIGVVVDCVTLALLNSCQWGDDLVGQHEEFLVSHLGGEPLFVTEYPASLKPFYARPIDGNPGTVSAH